MEEKRFDALTAGLMAGGPIRRGLVGGLAAGALAAVLGRLGVREAAGQQGSLCERCPKICETRDIVTCAKRVRNDRLCVCANTAEGGTACVNLRPDGVICSPTDECQRNSQCRNDEACVSTKGKHCCDAGERSNFCAPRCESV